MSNIRTWLGRITPKLFSLLIVSFLIIGAAYWNSKTNSANVQLGDESELNINRLDTLYNTIFEKDIDILSISIDFIAAKKGLTNYFLEMDRESYIEYAQPLFDNFKSNFNITHFSVISMNETTFVKLHKPESYGDKVNPQTLAIAKETMDKGVGIEQCPQKGFSLSVVKPFFNGTEHIGYIELRINMVVLLTETAALIGENVIMAINKTYVNPVKWEQFKNLTGERNNWEDMNSNVIVYSTISLPENHIGLSFSDNDLILSPDNTPINFKYFYNGSYYSSGRTPIYNASGEIMGSIILIDDITEHVTTENLEFEQTMIQTAVLLLIVIICISILIHLWVSRPIAEIIDNTKRFGKGESDIQFKTRVKGEVGELAQAFSEMAGELKVYRADLEDTISQRTRELNSKVSELEQYKKATIDRELKMVELKDKIKHIEQKGGVS